MTELINYKYLGLTVVLLLLVYFLVAHPRHIVYEKIPTDQFDKNMVKIFTKGKIDKIDPNLLIMNLNKVKYSIHQFKKSPTQTESHQVALSKFLTTAKSDISSYVNINTNQNDIDKCEEILKEKLIKQIAKKRKMESSDTEESSGIELAELENYIDVVITMIQSSMCRHGVFNFDSITEVLTVLNKINKTKNVNLVHHMGKTGSVDDAEVARRKRIIHTAPAKSFSETFAMSKKNRQIRHVDGSQTRMDRTVATGNHQKIKIRNVINHSRFKTRNSPEYDFASHTFANGFGDTARRPGVSNKSSGSFAHNLRFGGDKLLDKNSRGSLYF